MKFYPYKKGGAIFFNYADGEHNKFWGSFYTVDLAILKGGGQKVSTL